MTVFKGTLSVHTLGHGVEKRGRLYIQHIMHEHRRSIASGSFSGMTSASSIHNRIEF